MSFGGLLAARQLVRDLREFDTPLPKRGRAAPLGDPKSFSRYADPDGRFELRFPFPWTLVKDGAGVHVSSPRLGSFARVDVASDSTDLWRRIEREIAEAGGTFAIRRRAAGSPERAVGDITLGSLEFLWSGTMWVVSHERIALSLGNVVNRAAGSRVERYEGRVLAAIRRTFRINSGRPHQ